MVNSKLLNFFYYSRANWVDGTTYFINLIKKYCQPNFLILDLGCGTGVGKKDTYSLRKFVSTVIGIDIDKGINKNTLVDEKVIGDTFLLPFKNSTFDLIYSDYVLEHVNRPQSFVVEVRRVLKSSGYFIVRTPNKYHYVPLIGRIIPKSHKSFMANFSRNLNSDADTFDTYYKMNTVCELNKILLANGFSLEKIELIEKEPSYLTFNEILFLLGTMYEIIVNSIESLSSLRANIIGVFRKL